jgi:predicted metal-dependent phosphoesterase TrpH
VTPAPVSTPARFVDLHMHSTASDGALAPVDVVKAAAAAGLSAIALTDHDTVMGVAPARRAGADVGVDVIAGVELSAFENERETHLLGLHLSSLDTLDAQLATFRTARRERAERIVETLNRLGVPLTLDAVLAEAGTGSIGRPHIARAMVAGGWARDIRDAFDRYLGFRKPAFVPKHTLSLAEAIRMVHSAGGIAVLAHPGGAGVREWLETLMKLGLDGVEVRHPGHNAEDIARLGALADHLDLVPSGGSDWHGATTGPRVLNVMRVPEDWLRRQRDRVAMRAAHARVA